jgi:gliding motility-associated-like protein
MKTVFWSFLLILLTGFSYTAKSQANCAAAVAVPIDVYGTCGDMAFTNVDFNGAVPSTNTPSPTCGSFNAATNDMWYSFTVPAGVTQMAFHAFDAPTPMMAVPPLIPGAPACGPGMAVYRGTCGALSLIDCFSAPDGFMVNGEIRWEVLALTPGETIYVRLWEEDNDATSLFFAASVITSLPESDCANPPALTSTGCNILAPAGTVQAPEDCGWTSTDNVVFYSFDVLAGDPQPVTINIEFGQCWANDVAGLIPSAPEIQFAVYGWNGIDCTGIGGSPLSTPPNNTSYFSCRQGTGTVVYSENLPVGQYLLAMDGFSYEAGTSLCTFGIAASFLTPTTGALDVTLNTFDISCGQQGSASITVNSSCTGSPTITWSNGFVGATANNLPAGNHSVTVSDGATCTDTTINFTIATNNTFAVSISTVGNACNGPVTATANIMGANPASVTFAWNTIPAAATQSVILSTAGTYTVNASYGTCSDSDNYTFVSGNFDFSVVYTPTICVGGAGSAGINIIDGIGPYQFEWSDGTIGAGINIIAGGNYCVTVTDLGSGCSDVKCVTITENPAISVSIDSENITCFGKQDGTATAVATGGDGSYEYMWSTFMPIQTLDGLIDGNYSVTVNDGNNCSGTATVFISEPEQFFYTISPNQGICFGAQADITVLPVGGVQPYSYEWSDVFGLNTDSRTVTPANTTTYIVTVLDANSCTYTPQQTTVTVSQPISIDVATVDVLCHGVCNGSATLVITGGIPPFAYSWGSTTDFIQNLCAGDYSVSLTDLYNCEGSADFSITEPDTIYVSTMSGPATCFGYSDGFAEVHATGGVPFTNEFGSFYQYQWSTGNTQDSIGIYAGNHSVTVTDANGCSHVAFAFVDQPEAVYVTEPFSGTICIGEEFSTYVHATGGLGPYDFVWHGTDDSTWYGESLTVSPIVTTSYTLTVTDFRGCFGPSKFVTVTVNPAISIVSTSSTPAAVCIGESIGVEMSIIGGNGGPYNIFSDDNGIVNMPYTFYPAETGYYGFSVSDNCGSPGDQDSIFVTVHPLPQVAFYADKTESCPPGVFQFTETSPDFGQTYLWDFGNGGFSVQKTPLHTYDETGVYDVSLTAWSEYGCQRTKLYNNMIVIHPKPRAEFAGTPELVSVLNGQVEFVNYSEGGIIYFWDFGDGYSSVWTTDMQIHTYEEVGEYDIMLIAKNQYDCLDTAYKKIRVHDEFAFYAPTAFTPNGDGLNDMFYVIGHGIDKTQFYLVVYDRFGNKTFETTEFDEENPSKMAWDGSSNGSVLKGDKILTNGTYSWYCTFVDFTGKPHEESGTVTLIR